MSETPTSFRPTAVTWALVTLAAILVVVAVIYWAQPANALPSFLPGADATNPAKHIKHGIAALGIALVLFLGAWMTTGGKKQTPRKP